LSAHELDLGFGNLTPLLEATPRLTRLAPLNNRHTTVECRSPIDPTDRERRATAKSDAVTGLTAFLATICRVSPHEATKNLTLHKACHPLFERTCLERACLTDEQILEILAIQKLTGETIGELAVRLGYLTANQVADVLEE
jgi:hypothetical protein